VFALPYLSVSPQLPRCNAISFYLQLIHFQIHRVPTLEASTAEIWLHGVGSRPLLAMHMPLREVMFKGVTQFLWLGDVRRSRSATITCTTIKYCDRVMASCDWIWFGEAHKAAIVFSQADGWRRCYLPPSYCPEEDVALLRTSKQDSGPVSRRLLSGPTRQARFHPFHNNVAPENLLTFEC
jgi:hypothetical protein